MYAAASDIVGTLSWMFDSFFQICFYLDPAAASGTTDVAWAKYAIYLAGVFGSKDAWQMAQ